VRDALHAEVNQWNSEQDKGAWVLWNRVLYLEPLSRNADATVLDPDTCVSSSGFVGLAQLYAGEGA
jgi:hypothetical protein